MENKCDFTTRVSQQNCRALTNAEKDQMAPLENVDFSLEEKMKKLILAK